MKYTSSSAIERITKADLPIKYVYNVDGFFDFSISDTQTTYYANFLTTPSDEQYAKLDSLCKAPKTHWLKRVDDDKKVRYYYSNMWGNGIEAPEGEDADEDRFFNVSFCKGSKEVKIELGSW